MQSTANSIALILWIYKGIQFQNPTAEFYLRLVGLIFGVEDSVLQCMCAVQDIPAV